MINELCEKAYENSKAKGFYEQPKNVGEMIALMHSELSEALEADRKDRYSSRKKYAIVKPQIEEWRQISFAHEYEVSNWGRIRSADLKVWNGKVFYAKEGRIIKPGKGTAGYNTVVLRNKSGRRTYKVSRLVAGAFIGDVNAMVVNHLNGDKSCDWVSNLEITTTKGNNIHAIQTGLKERLSIWIKYEIAFAIKLKRKQSDIAKEFGVSKATVKRIQKEGIEKYTECFEFEMADICIRVFDMCGWKGIDLESHIAAKMRYNSLRPHKHGKKY